MGRPPLRFATQVYSESKEEAIQQYHRKNWPTMQQNQQTFRFLPQNAKKPLAVSKSRHCQRLINVYYGFIGEGEGFKSVMILKIRKNIFLCGISCESVAKSNYPIFHT
jgi:hypothetical protein